VVASPSWPAGAPVTRVFLGWCCAKQLMPAAGGADRRSAKNAAAPMQQSRQAHHAARPATLPEGPCIAGASEAGTKGALKATLEAERLLPEQADPRAQGADLGFGAPAGLEPATYGEEVRHNPSAQWCLGRSPQVELTLPSVWLHPDGHRHNDRIARGIASLGPLEDSKHCAFLVRSCG
jgi:hypothetical protein